MCSSSSSAAYLGVCGFSSSLPVPSDCCSRPFAPLFATCSITVNVASDTYEALRCEDEMKLEV